MWRTSLMVSLTFLTSVAGVSFAGSWPQFRGPNGTARSEDEARLPAQIGPNQNILWKIALPPGHSSPVIHGNRVYVTAARERVMLTYGIDVKSGKIVWEAEAPWKADHFVHKI